MKKDLENSKDIEALVNSFYNKVRQHETLGYIFNDIAHVDWDKHLPKMYRFWDMILFDKEGYQGQPLKPHLEVNLKHPLGSEHFGMWIGLFDATVDENFEGVKAEEIKLRAKNIAMTWGHKFDFINH